MKIEIRKTEKGKSLYATSKILKDEVIFEFQKHFLDYRTRTSMQIDEGFHQECDDSNSMENFLNHSCDPNGYINFKDLTYRASRNIESDEELTVNYLTHEWELVNPFNCLCGSRDCYGYIRGFKFLSRAQQRELQPFLSPFLKRKIEQ